MLPRFEAPSYQMRLLCVTSSTPTTPSNSQALKYGPSPFDVLWKKADPKSELIVTFCQCLILESSSPRGMILKAQTIGTKNTKRACKQYQVHSSDREKLTNGYVLWTVFWVILMMTWQWILIPSLFLLRSCFRLMWDYRVMMDFLRFEAVGIQWVHFGAKSNLNRGCRQP